jgi:Flp pilus assembly protein TadD
MRLPSFAAPFRLASLSALGVLALTLGGCVTNRDATGSILHPAAAPAAPSDPQDAITEWGRRYDADPGNRTAALNYAAALRRLDRNQQAVAVLETAAIKYPMDKQVLSAYGKALANVGRLREAAAVLPRAHTPDKPDWTVLSAQGSVADQLGDHAAAQGYYQAALKIEPNSPNTLSNLGLSYALDKQLPLAEQTLRQAVTAPGATMRVRQNLALVLALQGKDAEAERVARSDLSPDDARASVASIHAMIEQSPAWRAARKPARAAVAADTPPRG